jgi:ribonucleotide monophosphatase NagD (HAD superfamily)
LIEVAEAEGAFISNFYMIGDNPGGDIVGANQMNGNEYNWISILVHSGVYRPEHHHKPLSGLSKPTYEVKDMFEAIKLISDLEKLDLKL